MDLAALQIVALVVVGVVTAVAVALAARVVGHFLRVFRLGAADPTRSGRATERAVGVLVETVGHARLGKWPLVGVMHFFVFVGFGALFFTLLTAYGQVVDPDFALPIVGSWPPYEWVMEVIAWLTLVGIGVLIVIRQKEHPRRSPGDAGRRSRFFGSTFWQAYYVEATILGVVLCVLTLRGLEYALAAASGRSGTAGAGGASGAPSWVDYPTTAWLGRIFEGAGVGALERAIVLVAVLKILISMAWLITIALQPTMGVAWHRFLAFPNIWFKRHPGRGPERGLTPSLGELQPIRVNGEPLDFERVDELDEDVALGVGKVEDFTWKGLLDFTTCTECGRCQSQCPAWNTDKPLSPKLLVLNLRDHAHAKAPWLLASEAERDELPDVVKAQAERPLVGPVNPTDPLAGGVIDPDVLWSCTTCGACVEQCPVDIEHVDHIVDMRRYQVLIESAFPSELGGLFRNLERNGNPWGVNPRQRLDWAKDLPFEVPQVGVDVEDLGAVDYLFWVGCAGAFEDRQKKTTRAVAELLHTAGVSFAVLGDGESCSGDPARRSGNEFLFSMLATQNVEVLNEAGAKRIVVTCAHCFNALKNEYPQLGGHYEVLHHTQLLNRLVREGRLVPVAPVSAGDPGTAAAATTTAPPAGAGSDDAGAATTATGATATGATAAAPNGTTSSTVTYHDPCYIGRHNGIYDPPRELIGALPGVTLREMPRHGNRSFCCGAGGARMWMEEKLGSRINGNRVEEAVATGADRIAVACPFCRVMLGDGLTSAQADGGASDHVEVVDVAQMLLTAVRRGG